VAKSEEHNDTRTYAIRDAAKLVALLILIGGAVANYYIVKHDLESEIARSKTVDDINSRSIKNLYEEFRGHLIKAERRAERLDTVCSRVKSIERTYRRNR